MGAYFQTQIKSAKHGLIVRQQSGRKFLEGFYFDVYENQAIYRWLAKNTDKNNPVMLATVCDYDEQGNQWQKPQNDKQINALTPTCLEQTITNGYIVCGNEYINMGILFKIDNSLHHTYQGHKKLICPLALLTRQSRENMGGGDLGHILSDSIISSWSDKPLHFMKKLDLPQSKIDELGLQDITKKIVLTF